METLESKSNDQEEMAVLQEIRSHGSDGVNLLDLAQRGGSTYDEYSAFAAAMELLAAGEPVGFACAEGKWVSFGYSDGANVFCARKPEELLETKQMILCHKEYLDSLLAGMEKAFTSLGESDR